MRVNGAYESLALKELRKLSEAQLQSLIIEPILRSLGFKNVNNNSGPDEKGKDLVATKTSEFGRHKLYAIQIKKARLSGRVDSKESLGSLFLQLLQAKDEEVLDPLTNTKRSPDACVFITPYPIFPNVWEKFHSLSKDLDRLNIEIIEGSRLLGLIEDHLPNFLDQFSMEVRYRYQIERTLNNVPESKLAFGLSLELKLDDIFVDTHLSNSDMYFETIASQPLVKDQKKFLKVTPAHFARFKELDDYWGSPSIISDPPNPTTKEEKEEYLSRLEEIRGKFNLKVIQLNIFPLMKVVQKRVRDSISKLSMISFDIGANESAKIAKKYIEIREHFGLIRKNPIIFDNFFYFVDRKASPDWIKPEINISSNYLLQINCNKFILGNPGAGKTTLLRRLAQELARTSPEVLPIFLPLILVKGPSLEALIESCIQQLQQLEYQGYSLTKGSISKNYFLNMLSSGKIQLFLDGLDEFGSRAEELKNIIEEICYKYSDCLVTLSCRSTFDISTFHNSLDLILKPFSEKQLHVLIEKWFTSQPTSIEKLKAWLRITPSMYKSATNPLVGALLCSLFDVGADLPSTEIELYGCRFELLLGKWEQAKGIRHLTRDQRKRYWKFLIELAFSMHEREKRIIPMSEALITAGGYFSRTFHRSPSAMIADCIQRGVLEFESFKSISFGHLTYQEYLVARKLMMENDLKFIIDNLNNPWWNNTIRFYAALKEDISSLIKFALDNDIGSEEAAKLLEDSKAAPWTDKDLIKELQEFI